MIQRMRGGWVYIMTNAPYGTLYVGITADLAARVQQHRTGVGSKFCKRYELTRLVHCEFFERIDEAIAREKAMKAWQRRWKTRLIEEANPGWADLTIISWMPAFDGGMVRRRDGPQLSLG